MSLFFALLLTVGALIGLAWMFANMKSHQAAQSLRIILGLLGVILGAVLTLRGLPVVGVPVLTAALGLLAVALKGGPARPAGGAGAAASASAPGAMSRKEAAALLGVSQDASPDEIRTAHRELMKKVHPDAGGSDALAAKVQQAKDVLLGD